MERLEPRAKLIASEVLALARKHLARGPEGVSDCIDAVKSRLLQKDCVDIGAEAKNSIMQHVQRVAAAEFTAQVNEAVVPAAKQWFRSALGKASSWLRGRNWRETLLCKGSCATAAPPVASPSLTLTLTQA
jgi:hypothetical protein